MKSRFSWPTSRITELFILCQAIPTGNYSLLNNTWPQYLRSRRLRLTPLIKHAIQSLILSPTSNIEKGTIMLLSAFVNTSKEFHLSTTNRKICMATNKVLATFLLVCNECISSNSWHIVSLNCYFSKVDHRIFPETLGEMPYFRSRVSRVKSPTGYKSSSRIILPAYNNMAIFLTDNSIAYLAIIAMGYNPWKSLFCIFSGR